MNQGLAIFKKRQRLQRGTDEVSSSLSPAQQQALEWQLELEDAWNKRMGEIPPVLRRLPGQYQDYYPTRHEEVPVKRSGGRRYFDPQSLGEYPIMAQRGTENLEPGPLPPEKRRIGPKEAAGIYDPGPMPRITPEEAQQEEQDWQENIKEVLAYTPNLTPEERRQVQELNPKDWDDSTREKVGVASEQTGKDIQLKKGTSNVNRGLAIFKKRQQHAKVSSNVQYNRVPGYQEGKVDLPEINIDPNLYPNDPNFGATPPPGTSGSGGTGDPNPGAGPEVQINPSGVLGYDPSDPRDFNPKGAGSGVPTSRAIGIIGNFLGNAAFPGLGMLTGPVASMVTRMIQNGASQRAVQNIVSQYQQGGDTGGGDTSGGVRVGDPQVVEWAGGGGSNPYKGLNFGNMFSGLPEGFTESGRFGQGAPTFSGPGSDPNSSWIGGSAFGHPAQNLYTAIGFGGNLGGGGATGGYSNSLGRLQMLHALKGVGTGMGGGYGYSPLYSLTGTAAPSSGQLQQSQTELGNILRANPGLLFGPTSGAVPRGTPMKQSLQKGTSNAMQTTGNNQGLRLFMAMQGLSKPKRKKKI